MSVNIGPRIGIEGETEYRKQLNAIIQQAKTLDTEMKAVTASFTKNTSEQEKNARQSEVLQKQIAKQEELVAKLAKGVAESAKEYGENAAETERWKQQLNKAQGELNGMKARLEDMDDGLEDVNEEMQEGERSTSSFADTLKTELLSQAIISGVKALASAMAEIGKAAVNFGKEVVNSYADFEQLMGGVQKLFGEENTHKVMMNAVDAFKTAGLSANEYMETVTSFSASLISSLGNDTKAAVDVADRALRDMSDNANTFGVDMETLQNAYKNFAKDQYQMLDSLSLGYGGSRKEMERLIADAAKMTDVQKELGITVDANSTNFANIVNAISVVQTKMGITGTTAKEAAGTISGSITMLQKSWQNFVTMLGSDTDSIDKYAEAVIESFVAVVDNIAPVIDNILFQIPFAIEKVVEKLGEFLPQVLQTVGTLISSAITVLFDNLPAVIDAGMDVLVTVGKSVVENVGSGIMNNLPKLLDKAKEMIKSLTAGIKKNLPELIKSGLESLLSFSQSFHDNVSELIDNGLEMVRALASGVIKALPDIIKTVPQIIINFADTINDNMPKILKTGMEIIGELALGLVKAIPVILQNLPKIIEAIVKTIMAFDWLKLGVNVIKNFGSGIKSMANGLKEFIVNCFNGGIEYIKSLPKMALEWGKDLIKNFIKGIQDKLANLTGTITGIASKIKKLLGFSEPEEGPLSDFHTYAPDMMELFAKGIRDNADLVSDAAARAFNLQPTIAAASGSAARSSAVNYGGFNFIINAAEGQDVNQIADAVMDRIQTVVGIREAVFA